MLTMSCNYFVLNVNMIFLIVSLGIIVKDLLEYFTLTYLLSTSEYEIPIYLYKICIFDIDY